jgi:hypothetical protein
MSSPTGDAPELERYDSRSNGSRLDRSGARSDLDRISNGPSRMSIVHDDRRAFACRRRSRSMSVHSCISMPPRVGALGRARTFPRLRHDMRVGEFARRCGLPSAASRCNHDLEMKRFTATFVGVMPATSSG